MHRFAIAPERIDGRQVTFDRAETRHIARVLRLGPGDLVLATDGQGHEYTVRVDTLGSAATGTVLDVSQRSTESPLALTLLQGIAKGDRMERIIRAGTELGVSRIVPVFTARTVVGLEAGRATERTSRWQRIAREAAKQCGRSVVPEVMGPRPLDQALEVGDPAGLRICLWEEERRALGAVLHGAPGRVRAVALLVGPEGGLTSVEVDHARAQGWEVAGLGPRILRTETASLAAIALTEAVLGDLLPESGDVS
jgi:16S rRNA (uracil1498-N3)-methyltransferase